jgi:hypothetical protein
MEPFRQLQNADYDTLERSAYAHESDGVQDIVDSNWRLVRVSVGDFWYPCIVMTPTRFIIKMPILHRLACFRDDVVFLIFLYQVSVPSLMLFAYICDTEFQRWIYRIDPKRVNEYGQVLVEQEGESKKDK